MEDTRKVNGYTITNSMQIGEREVVLGENMNEECGNYYLVADFESNEIFERYFNAFVSDDYVEMASEYVKRITEEIEKLKENRDNLSMKIITKENCIPINNESFIGKVIVLRAESLVLNTEMSNIRFCFVPAVTVQDRRGWVHRFSVKNYLPVMM